MNKKLFDSIYEGEISINRVQVIGGHPATNDYISIRVEDRLSGTLFLEIEMDLESFSKVITGRTVEVKFGVHKLERLGKKREYKHEVINFQRTYDTKLRQTIIEEVIREKEVDGWIGNRSDASNHHNRVHSKDMDSDHEAYNIGFVRWVNIAEPESK